MRKSLLVGKLIACFSSPVWYFKRLFMLCEYHIYDPLAYKKVGFLINFFLKMMSVLKDITHGSLWLKIWSYTPLIFR